MLSYILLSPMSCMNKNKTNEQEIAEHYQHGNLLTAIEYALKKQGKNKAELSLEDLSPLDEFHIGGRTASENFLGQLHFKPPQNILDIGCGLGGAARLVANTYQSFVTGIDLTPEYIETGNILSDWLDLSHKVKLKQASALDLPFEKAQFDGAYMIHVGMNIENKRQLFSEVFRVLKPQSLFGIYDVIQQSTGNLIYPVPWAENSHQSYVSNIDEYKENLLSAGFEIIALNNQRNFALDFFKQVRKKNKVNASISRLGVHILMKTSAHQKLINLRSNIEDNIVAPIEIIAHKC